MAKDQNISIVIKARNMVAAGFNAVGKSAANLGRRLSAAFNKITFAGAIKAAGKLKDKIGDTLHGVTRLAKRGALAFGSISAAVVVAMRKAEEFNKQIAQITTLSSYSMGEASRDVRKLSAQFGIAKEELTKGLYDALSAGVPKENAFTFMTAAAKTAKAGAASTAEAVDILTTTMNAWGISYDKTEQVADILFTTVRLGKTTITELAASMSQVAPLASSLGVPLEQVAAAIATMTKQGTKTPEAMTRIRAAMVAMSKELGDGWAKTMTLQQGFEEMAARAKGSENALREMTGRMEGALGIMSLTGSKAQMAAADIAEFTRATGAMSEAFEKVEQMNPLERLGQSLHNIVLTAGDAALKALGPTIIKAAEAAQKFAERIAAWGESAKLQQLKSDIDGIVSALSSDSGEDRAAIMGAIGNVIKAAFREGATIVYEKIVAAFSKATETWRNKGGALKDVVGAGIGAATFNPVKYVKGMTSAFEKWNKKTDDTIDQSDTLEQAIDKLRQTYETIADNQPKPGPLMTEPVYSKPGEAQAEVDPYDTEAMKKKAEADAAEIYEQEKERMERIAKRQKELIKQQTELKKKAAQLEKDANRKKWEEEKKNAEAALERTKKIAAQTIKSYIEERRAAKAAKDDDAAQMKEGEKLERKVRRGIRLSKRDQEKLGAFRDITKERGKVGGLESKVSEAQKQIDALGEQTKSLHDIRKLLEDNLKEQQALSRAG